MYCDFFGLTEKPFAISPNPRFVFYSKNHREAFAHLIYGFDSRAGFIELTGEVGTGKTTVLRTLLGQLEEETHRLALIFNPALSALDLLALINREFGIPSTSASNAQLLEHLYRFLLKEHAAGRTVVLVIDEAQNLAPEVLEQIRLISNLETETAKLIQIVLAGQPELRDLLDRPELRQINQRITVRYHLRPMDFVDMKAYIEHRLDVAGGRWAVSFSDKSLRLLFRRTDGTPRLVNIICDRALLIGFTDDRREISRRMMAQAITEIGGERKSPARFRSRRLALAGGLLVLLLVLGGGLYLAGGKRLPWFSPDAPVQKTDDLRHQLESLPAAGDLRSSLNFILPLWHGSPLAGGTPVEARDLERIAGEKGLLVFRYDGSLVQLRRLDMPALLEFVLPPGKKRYGALVGAVKDRLQLRPQPAGKAFVSGGELEAVWSGRAYILWKNARGIALPLGAGSKGDDVTRLQGLLKKVGVFSGKQNGFFDPRTTEAVKRFQSLSGMKANGRVTEETLVFLYRFADGSSFPRLTRQEGEGR